MRRDLLRLIVLVLVGAVLAAGYTVLRIWQQGQLDEQRPAQAIVVMGAAQYNGVPSPVYAARLDHAIDLYLAGIAPVLVVTGGKAEGDRTTEAAAGRAYAIARGVPAAAIISEDRGRTTRESLQAVGALLHDAGIESAIVVSDRTHMLRSLRIATDEGLVAWGSPTTSSPVDADPVRQFDATIRELGALAVYFLEVGTATP